MDNLPAEILGCIFTYYINPYSLIHDLMVWRQINNTTYSMVENPSTLLLLIESSIRDRSRKRCTFKATAENVKFLGYSGDDGTESSEYDKERKSYFKSHTFIDHLLQHSLRNQFIAQKRTADWSYKTKTLAHDRSQFHDKVEEWIDAYSVKKSWILQLLLEVSLGREMIEYLGMRNVGYLVIQYFHKLFEPAIQTVTNWKENPKSELEFSDIFNQNLYDFLGMCMTKETFLKDETSECWFEMETLYNSTPRQVILFIVENFSNIDIKSINGDKRICSVAIFEELRKFGICVEKLRFFDNRTALRNYERTSSLNFIIPQISNGFYLQHFAVWIKSIPLLKWCLDVDSSLMQKTLFDYTSNNSSGIVDVRIDSHSKTYIVDSCKLTVLHYAVLMCNVEMVDVLVNKYLANFIHNTREGYLFEPPNPISMAIRNTTNMLKGRGNEEDKILDILKTCCGERLIERETNLLHDIDDIIFFGEDTLQDKDVDVHSDSSDFISLNENVMIEGLGVCMDENINDYPSDEEYEEGLDFSTLGERFKQIEQEFNNVLKRKRFDPLAVACSLDNFIQTTVKSTLAPFESNTWDPMLAENQNLEHDFCANTPCIKLLARNGVKRNKLEHENPLESPRNEGELDHNLITCRAVSSIIPKKNMNLLIDEVSQNYALGLVHLPNAKMLLQQAAESAVSNIFQLAKSYSQLCYGIYDSSVLSSSFLFTLYNTMNRSVFRFEHAFPLFKTSSKLHLLGEVTEELSDDILECIRRFESFTNNSGADNDSDEEFLDNASTCSSDSMVSNICQVELSFSGDKHTAYSSTTISEYEEFNPDLIHHNSTHKSIRESHNNYALIVSFPTDRDTAVDWVDMDMEK